MSPAFQKVRENARRASCQSNLKQIGIAFTQYTQDADEKFPCFNSGNLHNRGWATEIYPLVKSTGVYKCPDDSITSSKVSYAMNYAIFVGTPGLGNYSENKSGMSLAQLASPASTVLIYEGSEDSHDPSLTNTFSGIASGNRTTTANPVSGDFTTRHDKEATMSTNFLACDGHVKYVKIPYISTYDAMVPTNSMGAFVLTFSYL